MRTFAFSIAATFALILTSCAAESTDEPETDSASAADIDAPQEPIDVGTGDADEVDASRERSDAVRSALEEQGYEFHHGASGQGKGRTGGGSSVPSGRETGTFFSWCEGDDQEPIVYLDGEEAAAVPCSAEGVVSEIVTRYAYTGERLELWVESPSAHAEWAIAVGGPPEEGESGSAE